MVIPPRTGVVLERDGAQFRIATATGEVRAVLRGKAKRGAEQVIVGDRVRLEAEATGALVGIEGIEPRRSLLGRLIDRVL
jgi:putative ribosome biogenesis GTPase RsgA